MKKLFLLSVIVLLAGMVGFAQMPSGIDPSFGVGGYALTEISSNSMELGNHILAADGKILFAGHTGGNNEDLYAGRIDKNGAVDANFGNGGKSMYDPKLGANDRAFDLAELPDGKLLLAGSTNGANNRDIMLLRLNSDGSIDNSFHNNGLLEMNFQGDDVAEKVKVYDNKIYLGGWSRVNNSPADAYIIRLNMDGTLDQTFGTFSFTTIDPKNGDKESMDDFIIMKDGSIVVIGATTGLSTRQYICKMKPGGHFDSSFGINGYFFFSNGNFSGFTSVAEGPNGIIYICGIVDVNSYDIATLWKVDANGFPSATFGSGNGKASLNLGAMTDQHFYDMEILDNGDIFLVGLYRLNGGAIKPVTAVFKDDGNINTGYKGVGFDTVSLLPTYGLMYFDNVMKDADGNMIIGGRAMDTSSAVRVLTTRYKKQAPQSVGETVAGKAVQLYPNPTTGTFNINANQVKVNSVELINIAGARLAEMTGTAGNVYEVPAQLPGGMYYIRVNTTSGSVLKPLLLNR